MHQVLFSPKNNEKIVMNVICCSRDWCFKGSKKESAPTRANNFLYDPESIPVHLKINICTSQVYPYSICLERNCLTEYKRIWFSSDNTIN